MEMTRVGRDEKTFQKLWQQSICTYSSCLIWPTTPLLDHILAGKKTQHKDPFEELDAENDNQVDKTLGMRGQDLQ